MAEVVIKYNPFTVENRITIEGKEIDSMSRLYGFRFERLQMWLDHLIPILEEECNDDLKITFQGTQLDFDDLQSAVEDYKKTNPRVNILLEGIITKTPNDRFKELIDLFEYLQRECPFEDLRDEHIRENFYKAVGSEFEVSVIATMSSGKSTLINAMLGSEIMPSKNEACTATIARIKDVDGKAGFSAVCKNSDYKEIERADKLTLDLMDEYNGNPQISYIDIEGDIPFVSSKQVELVLVDTPGPNNSRTKEHRDHTYRVIKEKSKPMVLYVLNATQLSTNDDEILLSSVADAMKVGGKQAKDRFIFAVNKIDTFDTEKGDSIEGALKNVRDYLGRHGIENPNIYPTSAEMAKVVRLSKNGQALSKRQRQTKEDYWLFNDEDQMHLAKYAPLSIQSRYKLDCMIEEARESKDVYGEALIHSGVPAIEVAINEYLERYALTTKLKTAVDTFVKKIEDKKLKSNLVNQLRDNKQAREELKESLLFVEKQLNDGKKAGEFRKRIDEINMAREAEKRVREIRAKISKGLNALNSAGTSTKMSPLEIEQFMMRLVRDVDNLQSDVKTDLEKIIDETVVKNAESILQEYESYIQSLISDKSMGKADFEASTTVRILANDTPDVAELIQRYKYSEKVKIGENTVENTNKKWYKPWTWLQESWQYKPVYENREYVDRGKVYDDFVTPVKADFDKSLENAKESACKEAENFKEFFINEMDKLNGVLKKKVIELKHISESEKSVAARIQEDEGKIQWLQDFTDKLDKILEV